MAPQHVHDVLIIGAGVSGATAAVLLAQRDLDVVVVDACRFPLTPGQTAWLSPSALPILEQAGLAAAAIPVEPVKACTFYSADFSKSIDPRAGKEHAYLVDQRRLVQALLDVFAAADRSTLRGEMCIVELDAAEEWVAASSDRGESVCAKLLLLATGANTALLEQIGMDPVRPDGTGLWVAGYRCPTPQTDSTGRMDYVLGLGNGEGYGYRLTQAGAVTLGVCVGGSATKAVGDLMRISQAFVRRKLLPESWQTHAAGTRAVWSPAGLCLEMESHVAKRTLTIGQVGGFVASYTNEGIYPGMWSAQLAAQVIHEALLSKQPQDKLREFENVWRMTMAGYVRSPNTDAQSLLPLVFANQQMADKMLESLQLGANF